MSDLLMQESPLRLLTEEQSDKWADGGNQCQIFYGGTQCQVFSWRNSRSGILIKEHTVKLLMEEQSVMFANGGNQVSVLFIKKHSVRFF